MKLGELLMNVLDRLPVSLDTDAPWLVEHIHHRSFSAYDFTRFVYLWCEVAQILGVPPATMNEADELWSPSAHSVFAYNRLEVLLEFIADETDALPSEPFTRVGPLVTWLLDNPRTETGPA